MDQKHERMSGPSHDSESDVRGEHVYSDEAESSSDVRSTERQVRDRHTYAAGAEGTQQVRTPDDASSAEK